MSRHDDELELRRPPREEVLDDLEPKNDLPAAERLARQDRNLLLSLLWARRHALDAAKVFTPHACLEVVRRNAEWNRVDGYGQGGQGGGTGKGDHSDPTLRAAEALHDKGDRPDPTGDMLAELAALMAEHGGISRRIADLSANLARIADPKKSSALSGEGDCGVCDQHVTGIGSDRRRSELCPAHYNQWDRARKSDLHLTLGDWKRQARAAWAVEQEAKRLHEHEVAS